MINYTYLPLRTQFINQNSIISHLQSKSVRFSDRRHFHQQTDSTCAQFIIQRRSYLDRLEL